MNHLMEMSRWSESSTSVSHGQVYLNQICKRTRVMAEKWLVNGVF